LTPRPPRAPLFPYTTLFRSCRDGDVLDTIDHVGDGASVDARAGPVLPEEFAGSGVERVEGPGALPDEEDVSCRDERASDHGCGEDRKSTRLNSSHVKISYAV